PRIYLAQGKDNFIMSIERGRAIAARLSDDRYDVQYREFGGPRALAQIVDEALARFATVA
ncbi:MAG TPA: thioesterase, partial [Burkholderiaceae bacterium]|nr:thioesterase [Burkholderiaceae bacterium]